MRFESGISGDSSFIDIGRNGDRNFVVETNDAQRLVVAQDGRIGVNQIAPLATLKVRRLSSHSDLALLVTGTGGTTDRLVQMQDTSTPLVVFGDAAKQAGGSSWTTFSDRRLKQDVVAYDRGLEDVLRLRPVRFRYRDDDRRGLEAGREHVGFVAQEVRDVVPEAVTADPDGMLMFSADPIHWAALNAIRELHVVQEDDTAVLRAEIADLRAELAALRRLVVEQARAGGAHAIAGRSDGLAAGSGGD